MLLASLASLKAYLNIQDDSQDEVLLAHLTAVSDAIEYYCRRKFSREEITETLDGYGSSRLLLKRRPVEKIIAIHQDRSRRFPETSVIKNTDYVVYEESGIVLLVNGRFQEGAGIIRVNYIAGFSEPPPALAQAARALAAHYYVRGRQGGDGVSSESLGGYAVSYDSSDWPASAKALLNEFREVDL